MVLLRYLMKSPTKTESIRLIQRLMIIIIIPFTKIFLTIIVAHRYQHIPTLNYSVFYSTSNFDIYLTSTSSILSLSHTQTLKKDQTSEFVCCSSFDRIHVLLNDSFPKHAGFIARCFLPGSHCFKFISEHENQLVETWNTQMISSPSQ